MIIGLTSNKLPPGKLYDAASTVLAQKLSQIQGVGQVVVGGSSLPGVRIDVNPNQINSFGLQLDDIRTAIAAQTVNKPKGSFTAATKSWQIRTNDQLLRAVDYQPLIVAYRNSAPVQAGRHRERPGFGGRPARRWDSPTGKEQPC